MVCLCTSISPRSVFISVFNDSKDSSISSNALLLSCFSTFSSRLSMLFIPGSYTGVRLSLVFSSSARVMPKKAKLIKQIKMRIHINH